MDVKDERLKKRSRGKSLRSETGRNVKQEPWHNKAAEGRHTGVSQGGEVRTQAEREREMAADKDIKRVKQGRRIIHRFDLAGLIESMVGETD